MNQPLTRVASLPSDGNSASATTRYQLELMSEPPILSLPILLHLLGQAPFVDFGRPVIDPERSHFPEHLLHDGVLSDARSAQSLHATICNAHQRFRNGNLGHRAFGSAE